MSFLSVTWLGWMWLTVSLYWLSPRGWRPVVLPALSFVFLVSMSPVSALILVLFAALCYVAAHRRDPTFAIVASAAMLIVAVLSFYKVRGAIDADNLVETAAIPLGISYFSFRCIHLLIERYKGQIAAPSPMDVVGYLFFLPTFVVGPIHRYDDYLRDRDRQRFDAAMLSEGAERIVYGYAKVAILSNFLVENRFGAFIDGLPDQEGPLALYLGVVQNGLNLYFQFSGYSDIAIGFSRLIGYRVIENFNWPYLQTNISAFWRSWHISLSRWGRDYVYGSVVALSRSPALGALATMTFIGLWHEISFRFLMWGAYHGLGIIAWQQSQRLKPMTSALVPEALAVPVDALKILVTVHFVWFGFVILHADGPFEALDLYRRVLFGWL